MFRGVFNFAETEIIEWKCQIRSEAHVTDFKKKLFKLQIATMFSSFNIVSFFNEIVRFVNLSLTFKGLCL